MNIILFFLGIFCTFARGCALPFNDFRNLHNETRLAEAIAEHMADPQLRWTSFVSGSNAAIEAWPTNKYDLVYIPFCYLANNVKRKNAPVVERGWDLWFRKIGKPSNLAGHRLAGFQETKDANGNSRFCYSDLQNSVWNPDVPWDALVVDWDLKDGSSWSSVAYTPKDW